LNGSVDAKPGKRYSAEVVVAYRRDDDTIDAAAYVEQIGEFETLAADQRVDLDSLWATSDVTIEGDPIAQQAVRFAILQLIWASASLAGYGVPARGLSGRTYEGHHFWDSDVFLLPFLAATHPEVARELIRYRSSMLPKARERAADLALDGALFPWRTITGDEASSFFEAGTAQFHIDADVIQGLRAYLEWNVDDETLWNLGVELAVETARMWASLGFWDKGSFHFHGVTGPDEYTVLVNDNAYTNQMARMNLRFAAEVVARMGSERPAEWESLARALNIIDGEIQAWTRIAGAIVVLRDDELGVTAQDATFLSLEPWDWSTPRHKYPLLLHYHPLVLYRRRMLKQADVVMGHFLLPEDTPLAQRRADFDYYDPITTGDSSLSPAIQSAVAAQVGRNEAAWRHFQHAATLDLMNLAKSTPSGIHLAGAAGVWLAVTRGFVGLKVDESGVTTDPNLPEGWTSVTLNLKLRGEPVRVRVERE